MREELQTEFVGHEPCTDCGSKDNLAVYDDHTFCFGCNTRKWLDDGESRQSQKRRPQFKQLYGTYEAIKSRKLTQETCKKFDYQCSFFGDNKAVQVANYRDSKGTVVAQKIRTRDKKFSILGDAKAMTFFGSHLWKSGKKLVITEGEIDCMSVSQIQNHKWATVSLVNGAASAKKTLLANWDYLLNFDEIILMFDQDEAGQLAVEQCAEILPVTKARVASLGEYKDANEALVANDTQAIINAIFSAQRYTPPSIIMASDMINELGEIEQTSSVIYPFPIVNQMTRGIRASSLTTVIAGTGVGKSTLMKELIVHLHEQGMGLGLFLLEENHIMAMQSLIGVRLSRNIFADAPPSKAEITAEAKLAFADGKPPIFVFGKFGSPTLELIKHNIRFMAASGASVIVLDHLSLVVSGQTGAVSDERRLIDQIMTELRTLVQELELTLIAVNHLKKPERGDYEDGTAHVSVSSIRGSNSIAQLSDTIISLTVESEEEDRDIRYLNVLKNRHTGKTGKADRLRYSDATGRLVVDGGDFSDIPF